MLGVTIEREEEEEEFYEILPENWLALTIFTLVSTQWRIDSGHVIGLDYNALRWIFELKKEIIKNPLELLADIQVLEVNIVETLFKRSK